MKVLKITGVPEHFNYPWVKVVESQPFLDRGIQLEWIEETRGSGQMNKALREGDTDLAIVLTESFLKDFEAGNPSKMIGFHVTSPLIWGIHIHGDSKVADLLEVNNPDFLISRIGSGSHLMALVLAEREKWIVEKLNFKIIDNLPGALKKMDPSKLELFLWEKYTTKPWVDLGEMKRIGEIPSPWPCFVMVASNSSLMEFGELIFELRDLIYENSKAIKSNPKTTENIAAKYELKKDDVTAWLNQTEWATSSLTSKTVLVQAIIRMVDLGILQSRLSPEDFLTLENVRFVD